MTVSPFFGFTYIIFGVMMYLLIRVISDIRSRNSYLFVRAIEATDNKKLTYFNKEEIRTAVRESIKRNNLLFIKKNLSPRLEEINVCAGETVAAEDLQYLILKLGYRVVDGIIYDALEEAKAKIQERKDYEIMIMQGNCK